MTWLSAICLWRRDLLSSEVDGKHEGINKIQKQPIESRIDCCGFPNIILLLYNPTMIKIKTREEIINLIWIYWAVEVGSLTRNMDICTQSFKDIKFYFHYDEDYQIHSYLRFRSMMILLHYCLKYWSRSSESSMINPISVLQRTISVLHRFVARCNIPEKLVNTISIEHILWHFEFKLNNIISENRLLQSKSSGKYMQNEQYKF